MVCVWLVERSGVRVVHQDAARFRPAGIRSWLVFQLGWFSSLCVAVVDVVAVLCDSILFYDPKFPSVATDPITCLCYWSEKLIPLQNSTHLLCTSSNVRYCILNFNSRLSPYSLLRLHPAECEFEWVERTCGTKTNCRLMNCGFL